MEWSCWKRGAGLEVHNVELEQSSTVGLIRPSVIALPKQRLALEMETGARIR